MYAMPACSGIMPASGFCEASENGVALTRLTTCVAQRSAAIYARSMLVGFGSARPPAKKFQLGGGIATHFYFWPDGTWIEILIVMRVGARAQRANGS
jgi:hypothetical protein